MTYYNGTKFTWTMGRRLETATRSNGSKITYIYNADGLRTGKTVDGIQYDYYWNGDKLTYQTDGVNTWYFRYDGDTPIGLEFDGVEYYYVTNLQGDVIAILNDSGECVAEYSYDAWGNCTVTKDTDTIAYDNPLRYRGYYYDFDTKLYYLQSRFYDANTGRFINADDADYIGMNGGVVSNNLFAYCDNDPVNRADANGMWYYSIASYRRAHPYHWKILFDRYKYNRDCFVQIYGTYYFYSKPFQYINTQSFETFPGIMKLGNYYLSYNGCEAIAIYNYLILINKAMPLCNILLEIEMNKMYLFGNDFRYGVDPFLIKKFFAAHNVKMANLTSREMLYSALKLTGGCYIISYFNDANNMRSMIHTVAVRCIGNFVTIYNYKNRNSPYYCDINELINIIAVKGRFVTAFKRI